MNKAAADFKRWISGIEGMERANEMYERGLITLKEYIKLAVWQEYKMMRAAQAAETEQEDKPFPRRGKTPGRKDRTMKRYVMEYESDKKVCGECTQTWGYASSLKTAKSYIAKCRKIHAEDNPRNFKIYDNWADVSEGEHVPCIYCEP